jgi:hypothetical protein
MADLCIIFKEASILFSTHQPCMRVPFAPHPPKFVGGVFDDSYSNRGEIES